MGVCHSRGNSPEAAVRNLPPAVKLVMRGREYKVEPFPERLRVQACYELAFEIPGMKNENGYPIEVHEYYQGIGFSYQPLWEIGVKVELIAPVPEVQKLAAIANGVLKNLRLESKALVICIKESSGIGDCGYEGRAMVNKNKLIYVELELFSFALQETDYWEAILWHEAMHAKYILEKRWPSIWPFYPSEAGPVWVLDCLLHFSLDGWLEKNKKPIVYWTPTSEPDADFKSSRLYELKEGLRDSGYIVEKRVLKNIADELWGRDTNIWEVWKIMQTLGLSIPEATPLGRYLRRKQ